jgi:thioredoxin-like negative regulator of GroEL
MDGGTPTAMPRRDVPVRTLTAQRVVPVFAMVLAVIVAFALFDLLLVRTANQHRSETGTRLFEIARAARHEGDPNRTLELFRAAYNQNPGNPEYHLAFARALNAAGRPREGHAALEELLSRQPAHGPANAEMARVLSHTEDWQRAAWYYHRALYGEWNADPDLRALRFELANLLARHGAREQLVSEVVLLDAEASKPGEAEDLARLQLAAAEWARAERQFRSLLRESPDDPELLAGLARALTGSARYVAAERVFRRAVSAGSSDTSVQNELELVTRVNAIDPTLRKLSPEEKHRRSHQLASMLLTVLAKCSPRNPKLEESERELKDHERKRNHLALAEADLDRFDALWGARNQICGADIQVPDTLRLLAPQLTK